MTDKSSQDTCRLVLITPPELADADTILARVTSALSGGDAASLFVPRYEMTDEVYQATLEAVIPVAQAEETAVIGTGERRVPARVGADGIHLTGGASEIAREIEQARDAMMMGASGGQTRHAALEVGEARPDYIFFGKFGGDTHPEAHPKLTELAGWWAEMVEIPAILLAGTSMESVDDAASTGVDFVAVSRAVFAHDADPQEAVRHANAILRNYPLPGIE